MVLYDLRGYSHDRAGAERFCVCHPRRRATRRSSASSVGARSGALSSARRPVVGLCDILGVRGVFAMALDLVWQPARREFLVRTAIERRMEMARRVHHCLSLRAAPFFLLLSSDLKRNARALATVAAVVMV